jgi:threonine dehydrogenase-like Zn-dependent dehydrogenase
VESVSGGNGHGHEWIGQRVVGDLIAECRTCGPCRDGLPVMCENLTEIGFTVDGGCAGYAAVPLENLYRVPDSLGLAAASQAEPIAVVLHAMDRAGLRPSERVAVLGCGGIGLLMQQAVRAAGGIVALATDPVADRRELAVQLGTPEAVDPSELSEPPSYDDKFDVVFEASGDPTSTAHALELVRPGGRVVLVGYQVGATHAIETAKLPLGYISLLGVMGPGRKFREAVDMLASGAIQADPILTDRVSLDQHPTAMDRALTRTGGTIRVTFDLRDES